MTKREVLETAERDTIGGKLSYPQLLVARREAYVEHAARMKGSARVKAWASRMRSATGSETVMVWRNELPWVEALLVVRYGEAIEHWPDAFTEDDVERAGRWERREYTPEGVTMLERS